MADIIFGTIISLGIISAVGFAEFLRTALTGLGIWILLQLLIGREDGDE